MRLSGRANSRRRCLNVTTAICTSSKPDGDCCSTFRHLPLLFVLPLSLMVIVVLHEDPPPSPTFRHLEQQSPSGLEEVQIAVEGV